MSGMRVLAALAVGLMVLVPAPVGAWGMEVHKWITRLALDGLPPELKPFFAEQREYIGEHAADPDLWRVAELKSKFGDEEPNHFFEPASMGERLPLDAMPKTWQELVSRYGLERANKIGRLPWRAEEMYGLLVARFKEIGQPNGPPYALDNARFLAAVLAHYLEDAHQPFHATPDYDGQATGQRGIHSRFETTVIVRNLPAMRVAPATVRPVGNIRDFIFATINDSEALVPKVLAADRAAAAGKASYDDVYYAAFWSDVRPLLDKRLSETASAVASIIAQAWQEGGRPALPLKGAPRSPAAIRRGRGAL